MATHYLQVLVWIFQSLVQACDIGIIKKKILSIKIVPNILLQNPFSFPVIQTYNNGFWMSCQTLFTRCVFRYCILLYSKTFYTCNRLENKIRERKRKRTIQGILNSILSGLYTLKLHLKRTTGCTELLQLSMNLETQADVCVCVCICV